MADAREVERAVAYVVEHLRRNPLGCYGAAKYIARYGQTGLDKCRNCDYRNPCWNIDCDPRRCVVILEER